MEITTKHFGTVEVDEAHVIDFPEGIFGFEDCCKYVILFDNKDDKSAFCWLQSLDKVEVALPLIEPELFYKDYDPEVAGNSIAKIGELNEDDLQLYTVVVVPEEIEKMTTNLKAPLIVNVKTKLGIQVVVEDEKYNLKHNLYDQVQKLKEAGE